MSLTLPTQLLSNLRIEQGDDEGLGKGLVKTSEHSLYGLHTDSEGGVTENSDTRED